MEEQARCSGIERCNHPKDVLDQNEVDLSGGYHNRFIISRELPNAENLDIVDNRKPVNQSAGVTLE